MASLAKSIAFTGYLELDSPTHTMIRARHFELEAEQQERRAKQSEAEKSDVERRLEEMTSKYNAVKAELDQTLKDLEGL